MVHKLGSVGHCECGGCTVYHIHPPVAIERSKEADIQAYAQVNMYMHKCVYEHTCAKYVCAMVCGHMGSDPTSLYNNISTYIVQYFCLPYGPPRIETSIVPLCQEIVPDMYPRSAMTHQPTFDESLPKAHRISAKTGGEK